MNGSGGCCIARNAGGGGGMYGMSKVERIMLKYRPIAPKPVAAGSGSGGSTTENSDGYVKCRRGKRKYVKKKDKHNNNSKICKKVTTTLSLLPETPDRRENYSDLLSPEAINKCRCNNNTPVWLSFGNKEQKVCFGDGHVKVVAPPAPVFSVTRGREVVVSYVTVECVRETWVDGELGMGCTDEERVMKMEMDTCPGFISDREDRVVWSNKAFRDMVGVGVVGEKMMSVVLVRKDNWTLSPEKIYPSFTCKVRVSSVTAGSSPASPTRTLPCDVWRMEFGGCAWRLDVKAALSLGR